MIPRPRYSKKKKRTGRTGSRFKRGFYTPVNEEKYIQPIDKTMNSKSLPEYRSSWEEVFMKYCDQSPKVKTWGTEPFPIKYISPKDNKIHRYYIDFVLLMEDGSKHLIEIKPKNQCQMPVNLAKWEAATDYCKQIGATFSVVTEVELKAWGLLKSKSPK